MKYLLFLMMVILCVSTVVADDPTPPPKTKAQIFMDQVTNFANTYLTNVPGLDKDGYLTELGGIAATVSEENGNHFDPEAYFAGINSKVDNMVNTTIPSYEKQGSCKNDYLKEVANFFLKEYVKDMRDYDTFTEEVKERINTGTYLADIDSLKTVYEDTLRYLNSTQGAASSHYDPTKFLDKSVGREAKAAKIEIIWAGVNDHWLGVFLKNLPQQFMQRYGSDNKDFKWLDEVWRGSEVDNMNYALAYKDGQGHNDAYGQSGAYANQYYVDEQGKLMDDPKTGDPFYDYQFTAQQFAQPYNDGTYNNRSFGYRYNNGTYPTIKITTSGREYKLQESLYTSPIVLDMDGDTKLEASNGKWLPHTPPAGKMVEFDMDGDEFIDLTEWVGPNDGILVAYKGGEITVNNMFGTAGGFKNGYEKLSLLDKNKDGKLTGEELATLSVWQDKNGNTKVDAGEVVSLEQLEITSIELNYNDKLEASFVQKGVVKKVWDWYPTILRVKRDK